MRHGALLFGSLVGWVAPLLIGSCGVDAGPSACCCPPGEEGSLSPTGSGGTCSCSPLRHGASANLGALIDGFQVDSFPLEPDATSSNAPIFVWTPPDGAVDVRCALFQCTPLVEQTASSAAPDGQLWTIVNFDACALASQDFGGSSGVFDLTDVEPFQTAVTLAGREGLGSTPTCGGASVIPTRLLVGCWAFGEINVIGATQLIPLHASDLASNAVIPGFTGKCTPGADGLTCDLADPPGAVPAYDLGTCLDEVRELRCQNAAQCGGDSTVTCDPAGAVARVCNVHN